jgi:hypothetical protein
VHDNKYRRSFIFISTLCVKRKNDPPNTRKNMQVFVKVRQKKYTSFIWYDVTVWSLGTFYIKILFVLDFLVTYLDIGRVWRNRLELF